MVNFYQLVQAAMKIKKSEMMRRERKQRESSLEVVPPPVKELESLKLNQYIVYY